MKKSVCAISALATILIVMSACIGKQREAQEPRVAGGDADLGQAAIQRYGCGSCHMIPGIPGAHGIVGPPLSQMAKRGYLAGILANTPDNMIRWLVDPPEFDSSTAMPDMGVSESDARHIAAYLYTLD
jgi:cytochrome c2